MTIFRRWTVHITAVRKSTMLSFSWTTKVLRPVKWVTLCWFLFGVHPYQPALDFAFFILDDEQLSSTYDVTSRKGASKRLKEAIKLQ